MPAAQTPSRSSKGLNNLAPTDPWNMIGIPDPTKWIMQHHEFLDYQAAQLVITATEAGAGSSAITNVTAGVDGILQIVNDDDNGDAVFMQWSGVDASNVVRPFVFASGLQVGFKVKLKVDNVALASVIAGLSTIDTTPLSTGGDNVVFRMSTATSVMNFVNTLAGVEQVVPIQTMVNDTYYEFAYWWNGFNRIFVYVDGRAVATVTPAGSFSGAQMCQTLGIQNGSAAARTLSVDYLSTVKQRTTY